MWLKCVFISIFFLFALYYKRPIFFLSFLLASHNTQYLSKYLILTIVALRFSLSEHFLCYLNSCIFSMDLQSECRGEGIREKARKRDFMHNSLCTIHFYIHDTLIHTVAYFLTLFFLHIISIMVFLQNLIVRVTFIRFQNTQEKKMLYQKEYTKKYHT